jgi:hypothetical protein
MRRGIPSIPRKCMGKKVRFIPISVSQKWALPMGSFISRPVILGYQ